VRELENTVERGVVLAQYERMELEDLLIDVATEVLSRESGHQNENLQTFLDRAAADRVRAVLREVGSARGEAAKRLGIERTTLYRLMRKYGIGRREPSE
jgi:DNA-binding NtrC family response regulator